MMEEHGMKKTRTFGWYATHSFHEDGTPYDTSKDTYANAPAPKVCLKNFQEEGVADQVVTLDTIRPMMERYLEWYSKVDKDWNLFNKEKGKILETLHWNLGTILKDPTLDPEILRYALRRSMTWTITVISNPGCPKDLVKELLEESGSKKDPTRQTKGGEVACFALHNDHLDPDLVDLCARKTKRATIQRDVVGHQNVSKKTLTYLYRDGLSDRVKKDALKALSEKGWVTIK